MSFCFQKSCANLRVEIITLMNSGVAGWCLVPAFGASVVGAIRDTEYSLAIAMLLMRLRLLSKTPGKPPSVRVSRTSLSVCCALLIAISGCAQKPVEGPDKVFQGEAIGVLEGAGAGAVTGFQVGAGAGPGAAVGAGLGAVVGAIRGLAQDGVEETDIRVARDVKQQREVAIAQEALADHYKRRIELHPTRDIFPADLFFRGDSTKVCPSGVHILREIAKMNEFRLPYSRLVVAVYVKSSDAESPYAIHLSEQRSRAIVDQLVRSGVEPRRLQTRAVVVDAPVLIDPLDNPTRYNQAVEIIPADR